MKDNELVFPNFTLFHIAYVSRDLDEGMKTLGRYYGEPQFAVLRNTPVPNQKGDAILDIAVAQVNGFNIEVIVPCGGHDAIYRDALPQASSATRLHHIASLVGSEEDWNKVNNIISEHNLPTPLYGEAKSDDDYFHYVYTDMRPQLGHYLEFVYNAR